MSNNINITVEYPTTETVASLRSRLETLRQITAMQENEGFQKRLIAADQVLLSLES